MAKPIILAALEPVLTAFAALNVPYRIGGSVASSAFGVPRTTIDVDLVARLTPEHVEPLEALLKDTCYVEGDAVRRAIASRSSFNLIHLDTMLKVDVFVLKDRPYDQEAFQRVKMDTLAWDDSIQMCFATPEDVILNKLEWYRKGDRLSERQWQDVQGVLKVQGETLDFEYLRRWAGELGVSGLLEEAFAQARAGA